jgi:hypothetical protein
MAKRACMYALRDRSKCIARVLLRKDNYRKTAKKVKAVFKHRRLDENFTSAGTTTIIPEQQSKRNTA